MSEKAILCDICSWSQTTCYSMHMSLDAVLSSEESNINGTFYLGEMASGKVKTLRVGPLQPSLLSEPQTVAPL